MSFRSSKKNWEGLARRDPLWSICTHPNKLGGHWEPEAFFKNGEQEWDTLIRLLHEQGISPDPCGPALDFGCGVGRLTRAMGAYFKNVTGLDVSPTMIRLARGYLPENEKNVDYVHHETPDLSVFQDQTFGLALSLIVLQHIPVPEGMTYLREMIRVLRPGGILVVQVPVLDRRKNSWISRIRSWVRWRERLALRGFGKGYNMDMHVYSRDDLGSLMRERKMQVLFMGYTNHTEPGYAGDLRFLEEEETGDFLSLLLVARKSDDQ